MPASLIMRVRFTSYALANVPRSSVNASLIRVLPTGRRLDVLRPGRTDFSGPEACPWWPLAAMPLTLVA